MATDIGVIGSNGRNGSNIALTGQGGYTSYMPRKKRVPGQLGFKEAVVFTGLSESTFARLARSGDIPRHRPPAGWPYYLESELRQWLDDRRAEIDQEGTQRTQNG